MGVIRTRYWIQYLHAGFTISVLLKTFLGQIVSFSVVLLREHASVTRYDTAHGFVHRDVIGQKTASTLYKERYDILTLKEGFNHARKDLAENHAKYYQYYA